MPSDKTEMKGEGTCNLWLQALKIFNRDNEKWVIPKRGTKEYENVHSIKRSLKPRK